MKKLMFKGLSVLLIPVLLAGCSTVFGRQHDEQNVTFDSNVQGAEINPEGDPPLILDLSEVNEAGTGFKHSVISLLQPQGEMNIQKILDEKKGYFLSHSL